MPENTTDRPVEIDGYRYWIVNGRLRPFIAGGLGEDPGGESPAAPEGGEPPAPEISAPEGGEPPAPETFDREYVEKLRREAADYRTKYGVYRDAFDGYDDESREALLSIARDIVANPRNAAERMVQVAKGLTGEEFESLLNDEGPKPLTQEDLQKEFEKREREKEEQQAIAAVEQEANTLGYKQGSADYADLMFRAYNDHSGDLKAAHEAREAAKQAIIDEYLKSKAEGNGSFPPVSTDGAPSTGSDDTPKDFNAARAALLARLSQGSPG